MRVESIQPPATSFSDFGAAWPLRARRGNEVWQVARRRQPIDRVLPGVIFTTFAPKRFPEMP